MRIIQAVVLLCVFGAVSSALALTDDWTQFRGAGGSSVAANTNLPAEFDATRNIAWKASLPAKGASGPIVVDGKVVVTCSGGPKQEQMYTVCLDAQTGKKLWTQKFWATGRTQCHPLSANAAPTPASDGERIFAFFSSNDLACLDMQGNLVWFRGLGLDYPKIGNDVGMSASPVVADGVVVVQIEGQGDSFVMGLDVQTGATLWKRDRERKPSWSSPVLIQKSDGHSFVAVQSAARLAVLDIKTGAIISDLEGQSGSIPSPIVQGEYVVAPHNGTTVYSVSGNGELKELWNSRQIRAGSASAVVKDGMIYTLNRAGVLTRFDMEDQGKVAGKVRVGGTFWATPVIAGNHMYFFTQDGEAKTVELGDEMKLVNEYKFEGEVFLGSPAIAGNAMYFRSDNSLWKMAAPTGSQ